MRTKQRAREWAKVGATPSWVGTCTASAVTRGVSKALPSSFSCSASSFSSSSFSHFFFLSSFFCSPLLLPSPTLLLSPFLLLPLLLLLSFFSSFFFIFFLLFHLSSLSPLLFLSPPLHLLPPSFSPSSSSSFLLSFCLLLILLLPPPPLPSPPVHEFGVCDRPGPHLPHHLHVFGLSLQRQHQQSFPGQADRGGLYPNVGSQLSPPRRTATVPTVSPTLSCPRRTFGFPTSTSQQTSRPQPCGCTRMVRAPQRTGDAPWHHHISSLEPQKRCHCHLDSGGVPVLVTSKGQLHTGAWRFPMSQVGTGTDLGCRAATHPSVHISSNTSAHH